MGTVSSRTMDLSEQPTNLKWIIDDIKDWQLSNGLVLKSVSEETETRVSGRTIGMSLLPTPFPRGLFEHAMALQSSMNLLYACVASDPEWLKSVITPLFEIDQLARCLWTIYENVPKRDQVICGIFQSEYMVQEGASRRLKQIEMNTFAVAGVAYSQSAVSLHKRLASIRNRAALPSIAEDVLEAISHGEIPFNDGTVELCASLRSAYHLYLPTVANAVPCILMIVQDQPVEAMDERRIEYALSDAGLACYRCAWSDIMVRTVLKADNTLLFHHHGGLIEVALLYYRAGFEADSYNDQGIQSRIRLESSNAIKCPDILTHIATFKTVQQALTKPDVLERFLPHDQVAAVRDTFVYMQNLDDSAEGRRATELACLQTSAVNYCLKPNLERSEWNVLQKQIARFMCRVTPQERPKYTLMEFIHSPLTDNILLREFMIFEGKVTSELGIVGGCIWKRKVSTSGRYEVEMLSNKSLGWTFRTKPFDVKHSSTLRGWGSLGCPVLVD